jgi:hypothetical protein
MHERRLLAVADQTPSCGRQSFAGYQRRQYGRRCCLVRRDRAPDLGVRMPRKPGGDVRRGPQRELRDDPYVRVRGKQLDHIAREGGTGRQLLPALNEWICREQARPVRAADAFMEQGEGGVRPRHGIDVGAVSRPSYASRQALSSTRETNATACAWLRSERPARSVAMSASATAISRSTNSDGRAVLAASPHRTWFTGGILPGPGPEWLVDFDVDGLPAAPEYVPSRPVHVLTSATSTFATSTSSRTCRCTARTCF